MKHCILTLVFCVLAIPAAEAAKPQPVTAGTPPATTAPAGDSQQTSAAPLSAAEQQALVHQAEATLNNLKTVQARFLLTAADGKQQIGTFYLDRPGRLRFQYDPPVKDFVVADGVLIYFYDGQLKQQSNAPIGQTLADFILRRNISLSGDVTVEKVARGGGLVQITVRQTSDPGAGSLMLGFTENPMQLKKWRVVDAQGQTVEVELFQLQTDVKLDSNLFVYRDPNAKRTMND